MKIFKYIDFVNEKVVQVPQIIDDFVAFLEEQPVITMYPEDEGDVVREGWITKEHKLYSIPGIKRYFKEKYGADYSSMNVSNAIQYDPNIKKLTKKLSEKGMTLQTTPVKGQYGDVTWFYSVNLSDDERESIKGQYEEEFGKRYAKYFGKKAEARRSSSAVAATKLPRKRARKSTNEALELLIEALFTI